MQAALLAVAATVAGALAPPPTQVVLTGRGSFGEIHFDHAAHLERRTSCVSCHGPGPVQRPELGPAKAHAICRACHVEQRRGPTSCRECHLNVKDGGGDPSGAGTTVAAGTSTSTPTPTPTPTPTSTPTPTATATATATGAADELAFRTALRAGLASISGAGRAGAGLAVAVDAEQGRRVAGVEVDFTGRPGAQRTLALLGVGILLPLGPDARGRVVALCGLDAGTPAYALPAAGARLEVELRGRGARSRLLPSAELSVAWLAALGARPVPDGPAAREEAFLLALRLGWELRGR